MKVIEIRTEVFESYGFVLFDCKPIEAAKYMETRLKGLPEHMPKYMRDCADSPPRGVTLSHPGHSANWVIWLAMDPRSDEGIKVLSHEAVHAAFRIMCHWSIEIDENGQELQAALTSFIVKKILEGTRPKKKRASCRNVRNTK